MLDEPLSMGFQFAAFRKRLGDHYSTAATGAAPPRIRRAILAAQIR